MVCQTLQLIGQTGRQNTYRGDQEPSPEEIVEMVNQGVVRILTRAKPCLEFETPVMLSIDVTYLAYGRPSERRINPARQQHQCHRGHRKVDQRLQ